MSSPRIRRLMLDQQHLNKRFSGWGPIEIVPVSGDPAELYRITYRLKGLYTEPNGRIVERREHVMEVSLSLGYPRRAPQCKMLTPVFHPNFDEVSVCIGDFWAASEGLDDLIVRVGRMIAYQEYNTRSPLNGLAAKWAEQNMTRLPVDNIEIAPPVENPETVPDEKIIVRFEEPVVTAPATESITPIVLDEPSKSQSPDPSPMPLPTPAAERSFAPSSSSAVRMAMGLVRVGVPSSNSPMVAPIGSTLRMNFGPLAIGLPDGRSLKIGSWPGNDIVIADPSLSAVHADITRRGERVTVKDLGSSQGTRLNGLPILQSLVEPGDKVVFGEIQAVLEDGA